MAIICPKCGYENMDGALCCNLCKELLKNKEQTAQESSFNWVLPDLERSKHVIFIVMGIILALTFFILMNYSIRLMPYPQYKNIAMLTLAGSPVFLMSYIYFCYRRW